MMKYIQTYIVLYMYRITVVKTVKLFKIAMSQQTTGKNL